MQNLRPKIGHPGEYEGGDGIFLDMFREIQKELNFTYTLKLPPDGAYGSMSSNGSWNGMVHHLMKGDFDIGLYIYNVYFIHHYLICYINSRSD